MDRSWGVSKPLESGVGWLARHCTGSMAVQVMRCSTACVSSGGVKGSDGATWTARGVGRTGGMSMWCGGAGAEGDACMGEPGDSGCEASS